MRSRPRYSRLSTAFLASSLLLSTAVLSQDVRQMVAPPVKGIVVDGKLDEDGWRAATITEPFLYLCTHEAAKPQTRARVAHDDANLYLAVEVDEPAMQSLRAPSRPHDDGDTWKDDCVELFLAPEPGGLTYYQFIVNAAGARYDSCEGGKGLAAAWNAKPDWQATVARQADRWTAEIAIPFAALGVEKPLRGELWGLKICRSVWGRGGDRREDRNTAWAYTPSPSYHDPAGWGRLYFDAANLLPNGDFSPPPLDNGLPRNWNQQLVWQPDQPATGHVRQIEREGRNVLLLHKNPEAKGSLLPRATSTARARGGRHYRCTASVLAKGTVHLAFSLYVPGGASYVSTPFTLPPAGEARPYGGKGDGFETITAECDAPAAVTAVAVTFGFDRETTGDLLIRNVVLTDLGRPVQKVDVDLRHGLKAAPAALVEMKPYERLRDEQGRYPFERLIFKDTGTGAEIWRITWDFHGSNTTYSNMYPWNPNGATFLFSCWERPGQSYFLASPSGDGVRPLDFWPSQAPRWGKDPDLLFYGTRDSIMQFNWRTGEQKALFTIPKGIMQGGRPSIAWNMDLPGAVYYEKAFGTNAPLYFIDLKTGQHIRIPITSDSTGDKEKDWLYSARLSQIRGAWYVGYSLNHLPHLSGKNPYQQRLGTLDGKRGLNRLSLSQPEGKPAQPLYSHGGTQPAGRYECGYHSGGIALWDFEKWEGKMLVPGPQDGHISWEYQNDWFFAGTTGTPLSGPFASQLLKVYVDGTWYRVAYGNTRNTEYNTCFFANLSPDGTKGSFSSTMLGPINLFWCVISYPEPPTDVSAQTAGAKVTLTWKKPKKSAELAGYNVYRSIQSGVGYERITPQSVTTETFADSVPDANRAYYYVVTSVEQSGLESRCHAGEAVGGKPDASAPERLFVEAERGELRPPLRENLHGSASNMLFVDYRDGEGEGSATYTFPTRKPVEHWLWLRARYQGSGTPAKGWTLADSKGVLGNLTTGSRDWTWVRMEKPVTGQRVTVKATEPGFALDKLLLTDDPRYGVPPLGGQLGVPPLGGQFGVPPSGGQFGVPPLGGDVRIPPEGGTPNTIDSTPPATPKSLKLAEARHFDVSLAWEPVQSDLHHYQVYRGPSPDLQPSQATLIASPSIPRLVDWGLTQGAQYFYRVSAVDSFGNESAPSAALAVKTLALPKVVDLAIEAESGACSEPMAVIAEPKASGGKFVKMAAKTVGDLSAVPGTAQAGKKTFPVLTLDFDAPVAGDYIVWLKLCRVSQELGYAYLSAQMDSSPKNTFLCYFPGEKPSLAYQDTCRWVYVSAMRQSLPTRFTLAPGKHRLTLSEAYFQDFGVDQVLITNDLGKRPPGRMLTWE